MFPLNSRIWKGHSGLEFMYEFFFIFKPRVNHSSLLGFITGFTWGWPWVDLFSSNSSAEDSSYLSKVVFFQNSWNFSGIFSAWRKTVTGWFCLILFYENLIWVKLQFIIHNSFKDWKNHPWRVITKLSQHWK